MIPYHIILDMDEVWLFYVLPLLAAVIVAYVEYVQRKRDAEHDTKITLLDYRLGLIESAEAPDLSKIETRLTAAETTIADIHRRLQRLEEEIE